MSVITDITVIKNRKRANELKKFLSELDSVCDMLYDKLEFTGVWESLQKLEDVRVRYYVEYHECVLAGKGKQSDEK